MSPRRLARWLTSGLLGLVLLANGPSVAAVGSWASGGGFLRPTPAGAEFSLTLEANDVLRLDYWDYGTQPARNIWIADTVQVECLGELFGGQTMRLSGTGFDSALGEQVMLQVYLVDGGGADRLSLKARRLNGEEVYLAGLTYLVSGGLSLSCAS